MSEKVQAFLLRNTKGMQRLINERLAKRSGAIGRIFSYFEMGQRQYSAHTLGKYFRLMNYMWVATYQIYGNIRPIFSRFLGVTNGPLNYSGIALYFIVTGCIISRFRMINGRDLLHFNAQDNPQFWYSRYKIMFPPNFLNFRLSAHFIEINHIYTTEMIKRYFKIKPELMRERDECSDYEKRTRYITNPNYVYEKLGEDDPIVKNIVSSS